MRRVGDTCGREPAAPQAAGVAGTTRNTLRVGLVTRHGQAVIDAQGHTDADDLGLAIVELAPGKGLLLGFDLVADRRSGRPLPPDLNAHLLLGQAAYERGLIVYSRRVMNGRRGDNFLVSPPLILNESDVEEILDILGASMREVAPTIRAAMAGA